MEGPGIFLIIFIPGPDFLSTLLGSQEYKNLLNYYYYFFRKLTAFEDKYLIDKIVLLQDPDETAVVIFEPKRLVIRPLETLTCQMKVTCRIVGESAIKGR